MADVILVKDGKKFSAPADKVEAALAAGFAMDTPTETPRVPSRRGSGSSGGISGAPPAPPAGEAEQGAPVILEKDGKRFSAPPDKVAAAVAAGFKEVTPSAVDTAVDVAKKVGTGLVDAATGRKKQTAETESLPDFSLMPEMRQALISNTVPAVGSMSAPVLVAGESLARNLDSDAPGFGVPAALDNMRANAKTSLGTTMAGADEQIRVILANNPKVKARKDSKGNTILTSAQDGKEYGVPPGVTAFDAPRIAQTMASAVPAATAGTATVAGRTLGNVASKALAGGVGAALTEGAQAAGGGDFDAANIPIAAVANSIGPAVSAAKNAVVASSERAGADLAAENAARRAAQAVKNAESPPAPQTFDDVVKPLQAVADQIGKLTPKQRWVLKNVPVVGRALDGIDDLVKILKDEAGDGGKKLPKEAREVIDDVLRAAKEGSDTAPDPFEAARVRGDAVAAARAKEPTGSSALDRSLTATPQASTNPGRGPAPRPAPPAEPPPAPLEPSGTATAPVRRLPPPTEGLEPTEVLPRDVPAAAVKPRLLDDDAATMLIRQRAVENGTRDAAQLSNLTGLPSSQITRLLPRLVKNARFRAEVDGAAAAKRPPVEMPTSAPQLAAVPPLAPRAAPAPPSVPDPDLVDYMLKRGQSGQSAVKSAKAVEAKVPGEEPARGLQRSAVPFDPKSPGPAPVATPKGRNRSSNPFKGPDYAPRAKEPKPAAIQDVKALGQEIKRARKSAWKQLRDLTPDKVFARGEDAVYGSSGDPYADFADLTNKANPQSKMGAAMLDEINGHLGLTGAKRVRTPREAWAALIKKDRPKTGESMAETIRNRIEAIERSARLMRTIKGWEAFDVSADLAALEAAAKDLSHLENTGIRSLGDLPF